MKMEAIQEGFHEAVALDVNGNLSEGSGENLFVIKDETIYTPQFSASLLPGITRATIIQLAEEEGYNVVITNIPRELLYIADELFFTGTAAEVTPIRSVDKIKVGSGKPGPITVRLQERFFDVVRNAKDPHGWLKFVYND
jgi:branched-chain amino acid aminotransferase